MLVETPDRGHLLTDCSFSHLGMRRYPGNDQETEAIPRTSGTSTEPCQPSFSGSTPLYDRLQQKHHAEYLYVRSSWLRYLEKYGLHLLLCLGPTSLLGRAYNDSYKVPESSPGCGMVIAAALGHYPQLRLELAVFFGTRLQGPGVSFSMQCNLSFPKVVPWDSKIIDLVMDGDIDGLRSEFSARRSTVYDVSPDGLTLLHVCR